MSARTPEEIRADIARTREQLGDTVEALAHKTDVKAHAHAKVEEVRQNAPPAKVIGAAIGGAILLLWLSRR